MRSFLGNSNRGNRLLVQLLGFCCGPILLLALLTGLCVAQTPQASSEGSARTIFDQMVAATGWSAAFMPSDAKATVRTTYPDNTSQQAQFEAKGFALQRITSIQRTLVINGDKALITRGPSKMWTNAGVADPWILPFMRVVEIRNSATIQFEYLGTEDIGELTNKIRLWREPIAGDPFPEQGRAQSEILVWVSQKTNLPVQIQFPIPTANNPLSLTPHVRKLSKFAFVNGVMIPCIQEEFIFGESVHTIQIQSIVFNTGVPISDFAVTGSVQ